MRILVIGAGAVGGYFGGRLLQAGSDVTFLVRARRAAQLAEHGLVIKSRFGDFQYRNPPTVHADALKEHFDLILLSCKAYDLDDAIRSFAPAVGPNTSILPILNGMRHMDALGAAFGPAAVLGGVCMLASAMGDNGEILHSNDNHWIHFGEPNGSSSARVERVAAIEAELGRAMFESASSDAIMQGMWEKWVFNATGAGITTLMRAPVGDIVAAGGARLVTKLLAECAGIANDSGFPPSEAALSWARSTFTAPGSLLIASMFRDMERGARTEGEHVLGDLLRRARRPVSVESVLRAAYTNLATYEVRRARGRSGMNNGPAT